MSISVNFLNFKQWKYGFLGKKMVQGKEKPLWINKVLNNFEFK